MQQHILIADGGSTKTDWTLITPEGNPAPTVRTHGINPLTMKPGDIARIVETELKPQLAGRKASQVSYYGAGCTPTSGKTLASVLAAAFPEARIEVESDLMAAARALLGHEAGIAAILGTGCNSGLYDGRKIVRHIPPLGYVLGDEGSGAALGKSLAAGMLKEAFSPALRTQFKEETGLDEDTVLQRVYRQPAANRFLASLVTFIAAHRHDNEIHQLLVSNFRLFFSRNIRPYGRADLKVNLVGGIAHSYASEISEAAKAEGFSIGKTMKTPTAGLVSYHKINTARPQ